MDLSIDRKLYFEDNYVITNLQVTALTCMSGGLRV